MYTAEIFTRQDELRGTREWGTGQTRRRKRKNWLARQDNNGC